MNNISALATAKCYLWGAVSLCIYTATVLGFKLLIHYLNDLGLIFGKPDLFFDEENHLFFLIMEQAHKVFLAVYSIIIFVFVNLDNKQR